MPKSKLSESESEDVVSSEEESGNDTAEEKDVPTNQDKVSGYEKQRLQRIEENKKRMEALGLPKMASNFMGSVLKSQKKSNDKKGKRKLVDEEEEEYNPTQDEELSCSEDEDESDEEFSPSKKAKMMKKNSSTPKKGGVVQKPIVHSDFVDDDDDVLMQAIALSLQDTETSGVQPISPTTPSAKDKMKENPAVKDGVAKKTRRKLVTSRVHMNEDEMLIHFFQFDESGRGGFTLRDVQRMAAAHDFTWSDKEIADMIHCFDSDGDGKIGFDDFRKIVVRCNMLKDSVTDATG